MYARKGLWILIVIGAFAHQGVQAQPLPEFTGNYIQCESGWCEAKAQQMNILSLWQSLDIYTGKTGKNLIVYPGFFYIPTSAAAAPNGKPRFILYSGASAADPRTIALVEFGKLAYNDAAISSADGKDFGMKVTYTKATVKDPFWVFKRDVPIRFKPIDGKVGMFMIEPKEPLPDGLYGIDHGKPSGNGHTGLNTLPLFMGFYKLKNPQTVIPFVVGQRSSVSVQPAMNAPPDIESSGQRLSARSGSDSSDISSTSKLNDADRRPNAEVEKAIDGVIKGIFGRKD
jgi:hypothetical protein